ncbi:MAG: hypothetical protein NDI94_04580 [Candidatus Woesearchaeota archaeon]|nr:hypothetical protein [Candidatus Woesearchaeota archaeon]
MVTIDELMETKDLFSTIESRLGLRFKMDMGHKIIIPVFEPRSGDDDTYKLLIDSKNEVYMYSMKTTKVLATDGTGKTYDFDKTKFFQAMTKKDGSYFVAKFDVLEKKHADAKSREINPAAKIYHAFKGAIDYMFSDKNAVDYVGKWKDSLGRYYWLNSVYIASITAVASFAYFTLAGEPDISLFGANGYYTAAAMFNIGLGIISVGDIAIQRVKNNTQQIARIAANAVYLTAAALTTYGIADLFTQVTSNLP